ncbi:patatin-like phospholipase family protein [Myxococcota bacterium]|nr:patatin-like phospholipase family protein [Myxococcota bacterium]
MLLTPAIVGAASQNPLEERPRIGLVLSGGGARGAAHVGVIQVLTRLQIPVDYVVGTSMGAVVGGLYASGIEPDALAKLLADLDWDALFTDKTRRRDLSFRRKQDDRRFQSTFQLSFKDWSFQLPSGLIGGQSLEQTLSVLTLPVATVRDFDDLPVPFRAIATDIETGAAVTLGYGDLARAIRASMSIPGVFTPIQINGKLLVDGGTAMNLPVEIAQNMGADIIIAVDIATPLRSKAELESALSITAQTLTIQIQQNTARQLERLSKEDILLTPRLADISTMAFGKVIEASKIGFETALSQQDALRKFSLPDAEWQAYLAERPVPASSPPVIQSIEIVNDSPVSDAVILSKVHVPIGEPLDVEALQYDIDIIYGLDIFERVEFEISPLPSGDAKLILHAVERETGPNRIRFGVNLETDFQTGSLFNIGVNATRLPVNRLGAEWRNEFAIGENPMISSEFWQPLDPGGRYFIAPKALFRANTISFYNDHGDELAQFRNWSFAGGIAVGRQMGTWGEIRAGIAYEQSEARPLVGDPNLLPTVEESSAQPFLRAVVDTLDSATFPTEGSFGYLEASFAFESLGASRDYQTLGLLATHVFTVLGTTLLVDAQIATTFEDVREVSTLLPLGGFLRLSGLAPNELRGPHTALFRVRGYRKIADLGVLSFQLPTYVGGSIEAGNVWASTGDISFGSLRWGGSAYLALDTPLSPLYLAYGYTESGRNAAYLFIGQTF